MARGGRRSGAGRKVGSQTKRTRNVVIKAAAAGETPVDYMLRIMRSPGVGNERRDAMAIAAAPYVHARLAAVQHGGDQNKPVSFQIITGVYAKLRDGGRVNRQADYAMDVARRAWKIVRRQHPGMFLVPVTGPDGKTQRLAINPFEQMVRANYQRDTAKPATRAEALAFADEAEKAGYPAIAVAALICYEWLQRPEDVRKGRITWTDYRPPHRPREVQVFHHKTGERVWQPLDDILVDPDTGKEVVRQLYPEIEAMIERLPRLGVPLIMFEPKRGPKDANGKRTARLFSEPYAQHIVQKVRAAAKLPAHFTLEACRHGGMTELGDCELTEQEIMSSIGPHHPGGRATLRQAH